jgi:hypothetical protein
LVGYSRRRCASEHAALKSRMIVRRAPGVGDLALRGCPIAFSGLLFIYTVQKVA